MAFGNKNNGEIKTTSANNLAAVNNLYTLADPRSQDLSIETIWWEYERNLDAALLRLISADIDAKTWARILVPFAAAIMVRGPDFNLRFERRIRALGITPESGLISRDNTNGGRLLELQRLLGPVTVSKWIVMRFATGEDLCTNDLGYAPFHNPRSDEYGMAIPINKDHALVLIPRLEREIVTLRDEAWYPIIEYATVTPSTQATSLNLTLAEIAAQFMYGPNETIIREYLADQTPQAMSLEPEQLGFMTDPLARAHEFTWHRLIAALEKDQAKVEAKDFPLDWELISRGWKPMVFFPTNLIEFPPSLERSGNSIFVSFYDPAVYYALSGIRQFEVIEDYAALAEEATKGLAVAKEDAQRVNFLVARASALDELGRSDEAMADLEEALEIDGDSAIAHVNRGVLLIGNEKIQEALEEFDKAIDLNPDMGEAWLNKGTAKILQEEPAEAIKLWTHALGLLPEGPTSAHIHLYRGKASLELGEVDKAISDLDRALAEFPDPLEKALCLIEKAKAYIAKSDHEEAVSCIEASIELNSEISEAYALRSQLYEIAENQEQSLSDLGQAIDLEENIEMKAFLLNRRGILLSGMGENLEAIHSFQEALELTPDQGGLYQNRGLELLILGKIDEAKSDLRAAIELDPDNAEAHDNLGLIEFCRCEFEESVGWFEQSIELYGDRKEVGPPYRHIATSKACLGEIDEAYDALKHAERFDPESSFNRMTEAVILQYSEDYAEAIKLIEESIESSGARDELEINLVFPLLASGEVSRSLSIIQRAIENRIARISLIQIVVHLKMLREKVSQLEGLEEAISNLEGYSEGP